LNEEIMLQYEKLFRFLKRGADGSDMVAAESPLLDFLVLFCDFVDRKELEIVDKKELELVSTL